MDDVVFSAWKRGGEQAHKLRAEADQSRKRVKGDRATLENIMLEPNEGGLLSLTFDVGTKERSDETDLV